MSKREFRFVVAEVRAESDGDKKYLTGYAAKFGTRSENLGGFIETINPRAFDRALTEKQDVRALVNHDASKVLGRSTAGTLELSADATGLKYRVLLPDTTYARDLHESVKRGDVTQSSFGFTTKRDSWGDDPQAGPHDPGCLRELLDVDLFDVSPVTFPAYHDTEVKAGRSLSAMEIRMWPDGPPESVEARSKQKTVDGEKLTAGDFLIVGDANDTATWHLPWKFDSEAKTKSHLRDALARFDQVEGVSDEVKAKAFTKLVHLCLAHGIDVSDEEKKKAGVSTSAPEKKSAPLSIEHARARTRMAELSL